MNVVIVTADAALDGGCREALKNYGFELSSAVTLPAALAAAAAKPLHLGRPDLFVLAGLPLEEAKSAAGAVRADPKCKAAGILAVDDKLGPAESSSLLDAGADDCYNRPFLPAIFAARVRGVLRRLKGRPVETDPSTFLKPREGLVIQPVERLVLVDGAAAPLDRLQFDILIHLARTPGKVVALTELSATLGLDDDHASAHKLEEKLIDLRLKLGRLRSALSLDGQGGVEFKT
ncbi:MAG: response regulator transcription factor [Elusimicrobia bacterium]|nr:response regulator transcription factor [Elusimicrobiota bacterium]